MIPTEIKKCCDNCNYCNKLLRRDDREGINFECRGYFHPMNYVCKDWKERVR